MFGRVITYGGLSLEGGLLQAPFFLGNVLRVCTDVVVSAFEVIYRYVGGGSRNSFMYCLDYVV